MSWTPAPTTSGTYNVKAFSSNAYWRYASNNSGDQWAKTDDYDAMDDDSYKWTITLTSSNRFTIEPVASEYTALGISARTDLYEGYGYAMIRSPRRGTSPAEWQAMPGSDGKYSRISMVSHPRAAEGSMVLDTRLSYNSADKCIHFSKDGDTNFQRWVFRNLDGSEGRDDGKGPTTDDTDKPSKDTDDADARRKRKYLERRALRLLPDTLTSRKNSLLPDIDNVQGDVFMLFPKRFEHFMFFIISDAAQFKRNLATYLPYVTSAHETYNNINHIHEKLPAPGGGEHDHLSSLIAFSRLGLNKIGVNAAIRDKFFDEGSMKNKAYLMGDRAQWDDVFDSGSVHGVIMVTAKRQDACKARAEEIQRIFRNSVSGSFVTMEGRVRPDEREFFGWKDGISQPALEGLIQPHAGQVVVPPGVIVMGYPGDPVFDDKRQLQRPAFTKDGSLLVFRKLEQAVLSWADYIQTNYHRAVEKRPTKDVELDEHTRMELFGARQFGRWKSGVPLALSPYADDPYYLDPERINNFDYKEDGAGDGVGRPKCPYAAHIRKTVPRGLDPLVSREFLKASMVVRTGIPYGPEVSDEDKQKYAQLKEDNKTRTPENQKYEESNRGLLFTCYQSSLANGFVRQSIDFANNDFWPATSILPTNHGQDPIIGGPPDRLQESPIVAKLTSDRAIQLKVTSSADSRTYTVQGFARADPTALDKDKEFTQDFFVTSRGGEWFFVPGISALREWAR
ncbi:Dyp-type peroxidase [Schizopora paradoxa]|uniref:Dyp-type peroxidase n=1 Tax=Schizopora paradoxa TaxID=27342 RepID=A0A0H2RS85_9AGAM|nr:Dyp-type peroxidase [Schizopora paradoxa]